MSEKLTKELSFEVRGNKVETIPLFLREWMDHENVDDEKNPATCFVLSYQDPYHNREL